MIGGDARSLSQDAQEALRVRGVKLLLEGVTQAEVAGLVGVHERQVRRWLKRYRRGGWEALAKRKRGRGSESQMVPLGRPAGAAGPGDQGLLPGSAADPGAVVDARRGG